jgi:hypothetical protein
LPGFKETTLYSDSNSWWEPLTNIFFILLFKSFGIHNIDEIYNNIVECASYTCKLHLYIIWDDDDDVRFVLDQQAEVNFYSDSSLKQQSTGRHCRSTRTHYSDFEHVCDGLNLDFTVQNFQNSNFFFNYILHVAVNFQWFICLFNTCHFIYIFQIKITIEEVILAITLQIQKCISINNKLLSWQHGIKKLTGMSLINITSDDPSFTEDSDNKEDDVDYD